MTPDQHFTVTMFALGVMASVGAWACRRFVKRIDDLTDQVAALSAGAPDGVSRMNRLELALTKLADIVTELSLSQSRHEGYHEAHDAPPAPLMGGRGKR